MKAFLFKTWTRKKSELKSFNILQLQEKKNTFITPSSKLTPPFKKQTSSLDEKKIVRYD